MRENRGKLIYREEGHMAIETRDWDDTRYKPRNTKDCQKKMRTWKRQRILPKSLHGSMTPPTL